MEAIDRVHWCDQGISDCFRDGVEQHDLSVALGPAFVQRSVITLTDPWMIHAGTKFFIFRR